MNDNKTEIVSASYITAETDHMAYQPGMDDIGSEIQDRVIARMNAYDANRYTAADVQRALQRDVLHPRISPRCCRLRPRLPRTDGAARAAENAEALRQLGADVHPAVHRQLL